jgi:hypothetical protein
MAKFTSFALLRGFLAWFVLPTWSVLPIVLTQLVAIALVGCAATDHRPNYANTCDLSDARSGAPYCLPPPGFFCIPAEEAAKQAAKEVECQKSDPRFVGQCFTVMPSRQSLGPNLPICSPTATQFAHDWEAKQIKDLAEVHGKRVAEIVTICEKMVEIATRPTDLEMQGIYIDDPDRVEKVLDMCARELAAVPNIREYEEEWQSFAAFEGFTKGYGSGVMEVQLKIFAIELAVDVIESALMPGSILAEVAVTKTIRLALRGLRRMPIFVPGTVGTIGFFMKVPGKALVKTLVEGSSRVLGNNLKKAGFKRLSGEFAHHIVAHGDERAKKTLAVLKKFGIGVDDWENGVYLPGYLTTPNPRGKIVHSTVHTDAYYMAVHKALKDATSKAEVIRELRIIAFKLEHGMMP